MCSCCLKGFAQVLKDAKTSTIFISLVPRLLHHENEGDSAHVSWKFEKLNHAKPDPQIWGYAGCWSRIGVFTRAPSGYFSDALCWPCTSNSLSLEMKLCSLGCGLCPVYMCKHPRVHVNAWNLIPFPICQSPRKGTWPHMAKQLGKFLRVYSRTALSVLGTAGSCDCGLACQLSCLTYNKFGGLGPMVMPLRRLTTIGRACNITRLD